MALRNTFIANIRAMKLVSVEVEGQVRPGRLADDYIVDLSSIGPDLRSNLECGGLDRARSLEGGKISLSRARLLAPIQNPAIVLSPRYPDMIDWEG